MPCYLGTYYAHKKALENWAIDNGLNYRIFDATELAHPAETILRNRTTISGIPLWAPGDPVHLAPEAYREAAEALLEGESDLESEAGSADTSGSSASEVKRKRPAAVIIKPATAKFKRGRADPSYKAAGWLVGRPESESPSRAGRGGRQWLRGGWRGGHASWQRRGWGARRGRY